MKVTLRLSDGREVTFANAIDVSIPEKGVQIKEEMAFKPEAGKWFEVNPTAIDQELFATKRADPKQEKTRQLILEAFEQMKENSKYAKPFKTLMPKKTWESKTLIGLQDLANKLGDHNADWVEQGLEWAQRIANGETWTALCNEADTADWHRLVVWKEYLQVVGGARLHNNDYPASHFNGYRCDPFAYVSATVPLVVDYNE